MLLHVTMTPLGHHDPQNDQPSTYVRLLAAVIQDNPMLNNTAVPQTSQMEPLCEHWAGGQPCRVTAGATSCRSAYHTPHCTSLPALLNPAVWPTLKHAPRYQVHVPPAGYSRAGQEHLAATSTLLTTAHCFCLNAATFVKLDQWPCLVRLSFPAVCRMCCVLLLSACC